MATKAGVWIDHKQAIVVLVTDAGKKIKNVAFDIGQLVRSTGGSRSKHSYTSHDFVAEDRLERKVENDRKDFYDDVIASIRGAEAILILGPGEAKSEFLKRLKSKKLRGVIVELQTADKMTDRQIAAKVGLHFAAPIANKSASSKKTSKKRARAASGKRTNWSEKKFRLPSSV
jgi:hypothetical protein